MNAPEWTDIRQTTQRSRHAPRTPVSIRATFAAGYEPDDHVIGNPIELTLEITNDENELAEWLHDQWWTRIIRGLADRCVTLCIRPTRGALLHPVVLHHLDMLRRVTPEWRLVGLAYLEDVTSDAAIEQVAGSPYHEVRFLGASRPGGASPDRSTEQPLVAELFGRIHEAQAQEGVETPVLTWTRSEWTRLPEAVDETGGNLPADACHDVRETVAEETGAS